MKMTKQARRDGKALYQSCVVEGRLDEARVRQCVGVVIEKKPRGWLAALTHFHRLVKLEVERRTARVESPAPLDASQQEQVKAKLAGLYGAGLQFEFSQNSGLLGGLRVRVGSDVFDGSVEAKLNALEESF